MSACASFPVLFCAAAGPRVGFDHLARCRSLARELDVPPVVALHGGRRARVAAAARGLLVVPTCTPVAATGAELLVIDDPSPARRRAWLRRGRRAGVAVASVHELGAGYVDADLLVDGSVRPAGAPSGTELLAGPDYAILDPACEPFGRSVRRPARDRVLIALGGDGRAPGVAALLAHAIAATAPRVRIHVVTGLAGHDQPALSHGHLVAPDALAAELAAAQVVVTDGGLTLYEACAAAVPAVGLALTLDQHTTVRAMARLGAVVDGGCLPVGPDACHRVASAVARLLDRPDLAARQAVLARRLVDGRGARRVADRIETLMRRRRLRRHPAIEEVLPHAC